MIIVLQYWVDFYQISVWISHRFLCSLLLEHPSSHLSPSHPSRLLPSPRLSPLSHTNKFPLTSILHMVTYSVLLSSYLILFVFKPWVIKSGDDSFAILGLLFLVFDSQSICNSILHLLTTFFSYWINECWAHHARHCCRSWYSYLQKENKSLMELTYCAYQWLVVDRGQLFLLPQQLPANPVTMASVWDILDISVWYFVWLGKWCYQHVRCGYVYITQRIL